MNHPRKPSARSRTGFTLIELLTVIAIIGILAAILIPTVSAVRESARVSQCQSQIRQLGLAIYLYAEDHNDHTPSNIENPATGRPQTVWGTLIADRTLGFLLHEDRGGPEGNGNSYLDTAELLYCPASRDELFANDRYDRPVDINENNRVQGSGYLWFYYFPNSVEEEVRANHKITVDNPNRPYLMDFPSPGIGFLSDMFTVNPHENRVNVWHIGGHVSTFDMDQVNQTTSRDDLYDYLTSRDHRWNPEPRARR